MSKRVSTLTTNKADVSRWDAYVDKNEAGSFFHLAGWMRVIQDVYGHTPHYLYLEQDGVLKGVLPLVEQNSRLFGHTLISTPFCVYGGAIADDEESLLELEQEAARLGKMLGVDYIEFRYNHARENNNDLVLNCHHSTYITALEDDEQAILQSIKKKQRANVRQSLKNSLESQVSNDVDMVHRVYSESVRNLGTPVFPKSYFAALKNVFGSSVECLTIKQSGKPVSAVMSFYYKDTVLPYYGGGTPDARQCRSNDFMYYHLMCHARQNRQCQFFDFGRSKNGSGSGSYKKSWGISSKPLFYYCQLIKADSLPNLSPDNPKYKFFINVWKKLPLFVSERVGPYLSKFLG